MKQRNRRCWSSYSSSSSTLFPLLFFRFCCCFLLIGFSVSTSVSTFLSGDVFEDRASIGRNLLQMPKNCPVSFETMNYTIITSQCKGPKYEAKSCCTSFKEFACPYAAYLNDLTNNCADTMFSYIGKVGNYPPGLFASLCQDGKKGLTCPAAAPTELSPDSSGSRFICNPSPLLVLTMGLLELLLQIF